MHRELSQENQTVNCLGVYHHDCLGGNDAVFGSAETHDIDSGIGNHFLERDTERRSRIPDSGAIQVKKQFILVAVVSYRLNFRDGVDGPNLGALGDRNHQGLRSMLKVNVVDLSGD